MFWMALEEFKVTNIFFSEKQCAMNAVVLKEIRFYWLSKWGICLLWPCRMTRCLSPFHHVFGSYLHCNPQTEQSFSGLNLLQKGFHLKKNTVRFSLKPLHFWAQALSD